MKRPASKGIAHRLGSDRRVLHLLPYHRAEIMSGFTAGTIIAPLCEMCEAPATKERYGGFEWHPICDECSEWFAPNRIRSPESHMPQHPDDQH